MNIDSLIKFTREKYKVIIILFFLLYFFIGLLIFNDYGISWDEPARRYFGITNVKYIVQGEEELKFYPTGGQAFSMLLIIIEKIFNLTDDLRAVYLMRHFMTFLLFYTGVVFFYLIVKKIYNSWKIGILSCLFLVISPRIFADSFYNPIDIPFLSLFIISIFTLLNFLDKKTVLSAFVHALVSAILINIRSLGVIVIVFTVAFFTSDLISIRPLGKQMKAGLRNISIYIILAIGLAILFWPGIWSNPFLGIYKSFTVNIRYHHEAAQLYLGRFVLSTDLPWHYCLTWISITTPIVYLLFFLTGVFFTLRTFIIKKYHESYETNRKNIIILLWFFLPVLTVIILKSTIYDGWRHLYFIYPAFIIIAIKGLVSLYRYFSGRTSGTLKRVISAAMVLLVVASLANSAWFMVRNHPYQNVYFNIVAGTNMQVVKKRFDMDYWGLSYRQALEYIIENDENKNIKIHSENEPGEINSYILPEGERNRLEFVDKPEDAKYFISNYRRHPDEYAYDNEFFSIKVGNAKIMVVYVLEKVATFE